ncbi:MAG: efflux RND transporter permease subunit [Pirellulales bacterium]|nr:efflux RND transporter permease subunit [Pirellulales bacterium]
MNLSALSIRHSRILIVVLMTMVAWGGAALWLLPRQEEPVLTWRLANVITRLPGASVERMESLVTEVLERYVEEVDEVEHIYSVSRAGLSLLQIELSDDVTDAGPVWQKVRHRLTQATIELPPGVRGPDLDDEIMGTFAQLIAVRSNSATYRRLKDHAQRLEDELRYLPMTASTSLFGDQQEVVQVELDPAKLAAYHLSFAQVAAALRSRNTRRPSGRLPVQQNELLVEASGEFETDDQVREMVLAITPEGRAVHLGDVAEIVRTTREPTQPLARVDGKPAVVVGVRARQDLRIDDFGARVDRVVAAFRKTLPADVECVVFHDLAGYTRQRAGQLSRTLLMSIALVFLATAVFMGWRGACVVTATIPLTGLIVLAVFLAVGIPLNEMSVMAIIMAFGLLVDDAIVITEQVHRRVAEGVAVDVAAAEEPHGLTAPLVVTTLTTIAAFVPIYLLPGGVGEFVRAIPVSLAICLLAALTVSVTAIPWLCTCLMAEPGPEATTPGKLVAMATRPVEVIKYLYRAVLARAVVQPATMLLLIVIVLAALAALGLSLRRDFFSPVQRDQFVIDLYGPQGSSLSHTSELVRQVESILAGEDAIVSTAALIGRNAPLVFYNLESQETYANHFAQLIVRVADWEQTAGIARRVQDKLQAEVAGAECCVHILEHGAPFVAPFEIRIRGPSLVVLRELGRRAAEQLQQTAGVRNVRTNYGNDVLKLVAEVNEPVARRIGIDQGTVADALRHRLDGLEAGYIQEGDERVDILVRFPAAARRDIADLEAVYFKPSVAAGLIPFSTVAALVPTWEASSVYRRDGQRTLSVLAYPQFGLTPAEVSRQFAAWMSPMQKELPPGYTIELGGENEQRHEAETNLMKNAVYAVFLILLCLTAEFRSFRLTAMILALIPLALGGAMLALFLTGWPLNFMALMGTMMLIGVVINDALILVDGFESRRTTGEPIARVVVAGTLQRSRHVVITTVTTVAGFLPLALSPSLLWPPLAIVIIGGLLLATLVTLLAIPAAYVLVRK